MPFYPVLPGLNKILMAKFIAHRDFGTGCESESKSDWGYRTHPVTGKKGAWHNGVDLGAPQGTPIYAPLDGYVEAAYEGNISGYLIRLTHDDPEFPEVHQTKYAHLSAWAVKKGDFVKKGQLIGYVGGKKGTPGAGMSTGPHLHFIVSLKKPYRKSVCGAVRSDTDPLPYLMASGGVRFLPFVAVGLLALALWLRR